MRHAIALGVLTLIAALLCVPSAPGAGDELTKLKARIEQLEAENKALKEQIRNLLEKLAAQKQSSARKEVVIEIDGIDDIRMGEKKLTLSELRKEFGAAPPREIVVRNKGTTTLGLQTDMESFLRRIGFQKDSQLGGEQIWVRSAPPSKAP